MMKLATKRDQELDPNYYVAFANYYEHFNGYYAVVDDYDNVYFESDDISEAFNKFYELDDEALSLTREIEVFKNRGYLPYFDSEIPDFTKFRRAGII